MIFINPYLNASAPIADSRFIFTVNTQNLSTGSTANGIFRLPLTSASTINATVDWGDNTSDLITVWNQAQTTHTYTTGGEYEIKISGVINGFRFSNGGDRLKILNISNWGSFNFSQDAAFHGCANLTSNATDIPIITTTNFRRTFNLCTNFNGNVSNWNVSGVTSFESLFAWNSNFNQDISGWDLSSATDISSMLFRTTIFNQDISSWNVSNVTNALNLFFLSSFSTVNYDKLLIAWSQLSLRSNVTLTVQGTNYTLGGAAEAGRNVLTGTYNWTISDLGGI